MDDGPMMIRIRDNAGDAASGINLDWKRMMQQVQGQWLEVETDHLFRDQFNTAPILGVSESGMRIMQSDVAEIRNDARVGKSRCNWCGAITGGAACGTCGKSEYLKPLVPGSTPAADELEEQWAEPVVEPTNRSPRLDLEEQWAESAVEPRRVSKYHVASVMLG